MTETIKVRIEAINRGELPEGYQRTKAGIMPEDWDGNVRAKQLFKSHTDKKHNGDLEILASTQERGIVPRSQLGIGIQCSDEGVKGYKKVAKGDFVISLRSFQGGIEYSEYDGIVSPAYTVLKPLKDISTGFYKSYFKTDSFIDRLNGAVYGIRDGKQIGYEDFGDMYVHCPPLAEQERIAEILMQCDKVIELKQKRIEEEKKKKKWLVDKLIVIPHKAQRLGAVCTVGDVAEVVGRIGFRGYTKEDLVSAEEGAMSMSPSNMSDGEVDFSLGSYISWKKYNESPEIMLQKDDILFVKTGSTYGKCAQVRVLSEPATINPQLAIIRASKVNPDYLVKVLESDIVQRRVKQIVVGGAVPTLTQEEIRNLEISIPSPVEQHKISVILLQQDDLIKKLNEEVHLLLSKKKSLMQLLLTGIVRTTV